MMNEVKFLLKYGFKLAEPEEMKKIDFFDTTKVTEVASFAYYVFFRMEDYLIAHNFSETSLTLFVPEGSVNIKPFLELLEEEWLDKKLEEAV